MLEDLLEREICRFGCDGCNFEVVVKVDRHPNGASFVVVTVRQCDLEPQPDPVLDRVKTENSLQK